MPYLIGGFLVWFGLLIGRFTGPKDIFTFNIPFTATTKINRFPINHRTLTITPIRKLNPSLRLRTKHRRTMGLCCMDGQLGPNTIHRKLLSWSQRLHGPSCL